MAPSPPPAPAGRSDETQQLRGLVYALARQLEEHTRSCVAGLGLTAPQANALRELGGPLTMRELAARMCCEPSNVTFVVDRLEKDGLVERRPHPQDRRARLLVLTGAGAARRERLLERVAADSPLSRLTEEDRQALQTLLQRAVSSPPAHGGAPGDGARG